MLLPLLSSPVAAEAPASPASAALAPPIAIEEVAGNESEMHYVDPQLRPYPGGEAENHNFLVDRLIAAKETYADNYADLPQTHLEYERELTRGMRGGDVAALRARLGLGAGDRFDEALGEAVSRYRDLHGLEAGNTADRELIDSLNRGAAHYLALLDRNIERARAIPQDLPARFVFVDVAAQRLSMFDGEREVDAMKAIVGKRAMPTPALAAYIRRAEVNPYWNLPSDLIQTGVARRAAAQGAGYLRRAGYQVLSDYNEDARLLDPRGVDWRAVMQGEDDVRVVQKPGPYNAMGDVKFMFPNHLGIYLHDTPHTQLFDRDSRLFSAGCVRLEDAARLGRWLFGSDVVSSSEDPAHEVPLAEPVALFITYLTAWPEENGRVFRPDIYGRDAVDDEGAPMRIAAAG
ncbi:L,D-transpeptidase family protein [Erythrobacter sp.]|uniref:L,D-transpeptidase family protein n=1 Tax=Erythrobacter sp. TaxID=1042 RepID=UPI002ECD810E|nr:L,D-transpeptidase family protein [Erythrobacter sp.]